LFEHSCLLLLKIWPGRPPAALMLPGDLSDIDALTAGPGGSIWFTGFGTGQIGELPLRGSHNTREAIRRISDITLHNIRGMLPGILAA
jgi:hypothetical protein